MEPFAEDATSRQKYEPAMSITDEAEARAWFERCVEHTMRVRPTDDRAEAESIERQNLGYYAGYYNHETQARVERLFRCAHPIFGAIAQYPRATPAEAFEIGRRIGEARKP